MVVAEQLRGPWPEVRQLVVAELDAYVADVGDDDVLSLPTRCTPWTVRDVTAHLAATFGRFNRMLVQGRHGDLGPPFARDDLGVVNLRAVEQFEGDPVQRLRTEALAFVADASDPLEVMPHQFGPIPVGLQLCFGLNELALHHDDVAGASGGGYRPDEDVSTALAEVSRRTLGGLPADADPWTRILRASGRREV